jgi:hypothetical protein
MSDAEKLIELLGKATSACVGTDCFEGCKYYAENDCRYKLMADILIANSVTIQPLTDCKQPVTDNNVGCKWIPVTERFPEKTRVPKDVLVYHKLGNCGMYVDRAWYDSDRNKWRSALSMNMKVTHWMPMPEPPKEN